MPEDGNNQRKQAQPQGPGASGTPDQGSQLRVDESRMSTSYASTTRVVGTAEEITIDFAQGLRRTADNQPLMKTDVRVILSPWGAKRLVMALAQTVQQYEQTYGPVEVNPSKRVQGGQDAAAAPSA